MPTKPKYQRILLKLSGEALMGEEDYGIDPKVIGRLAKEILEVRADRRAGRRGDRRRQHLPRRGARGGRHGSRHRRPHGHAGDGDERAGDAGFDGETRRLRARDERAQIHDVCEDFIRRRAVRHLEKGRIVLFAGGTGNPFFTTDSAAALRAVEVGADLLLKATKVDGVYSADPKKKKDARRFEHVSYEDVISRNLQVMDTAAIALCRDHNMPLRIYDMTKPRNLMRIMQGEPIGTLVDAG